MSIVLRAEEDHAHLHRVVHRRPCHRSREWPAAAAPPTPSSADHVPLRPHHAALLTVRHAPDVVEDAQMIAPAITQILFEQVAWQRIGRLLEPDANGRLRVRRFGQSEGLSIYEWQATTAGKPGQSELLDLFLRPDARLDGVSDVFLFARDKVNHREARFAAQELVPVFTRHLRAAAVKAPTRYWLSVRLPPFDYDFQAKAIRFLKEGVVFVSPTPAFREGHDLLHPIVNASAGYALMDRASAAATYSLLGVVPSIQQDDSAASAAKPDSPTVAWRGLFPMGVSAGPLPPAELIAFDRQLRLGAIPLDSGRAEKLVQHNAYKQTRGGLTARLFFEVHGVELATQRADRTPRKLAVLLARLGTIDILDPDDAVLASIKAAALPTPLLRSTNRVC